MQLHSNLAAVGVDVEIYNTYAERAFNSQKGVIKRLFPWYKTEDEVQDVKSWKEKIRVLLGLRKPDGKPRKKFLEQLRSKWQTLAGRKKD